MRQFIENLFLFSFFQSLAFAQTILLPNEWYFKLGDDSSYKSTRLDDLSWDKIKVPSHWENFGYQDYDGFAWYRLHFSINSKALEQDFYLLVGKIDDVDETYLNGVLVGSTGKFPPYAQSAWNQQRAYKIPKGLLKENNILAIRVYDMGAPGGIHSGILGLLGKTELEKELNLGPGPKKSFYQLVTSNGLIAAVYNEKQRQIENVYPHIFAAYDSVKKVKPFVKNLRLSIDASPIFTRYELNSHIILVKYKEFEVRYFTSFTENNKIFYTHIIGEDENIENIRIDFLSVESEIISEKIIRKLNNGKVEKYFLLSFNDSLHNNSKNLLQAKSKILSSTSFIKDELNFIKDLFSRSNFPKELKQDERDLFEQSITVLKMAQVSQKEIFEKARGQILASLPPGMWNITWIRDAAYSIYALTKLGLFEEAKSALKFFLNAETGSYRKYIHSDGLDYGIKVNYKISVCRYFGMGLEESDFNENGPNIELDGFGLFLWAFCEYVKRSGDEEFLNEYFNLAENEIADVIVISVEKNDLIRKDSGPWERHLPGKQFAYTSIACAKGLKLFADLCKKRNLNCYEKYSSAYKRLVNGIKAHLIVNGRYLKGNFESSKPNEYDHFDAATFEAFNFNLFDDKPFFDSHFSEYSSNLKFKDKQRGFFRINNGDWYDSQEWVFLDLRIASALMKFGEIKKAKELLKWITEQSKLNFNQIAELYEEKTSAYEGACPMVGFGAGSYIISQFELDTQN
jgi:GH15 family glucan-1,4-alpha-glucosidase